jgi:hypothetical protein
VVSARSGAPVLVPHSSSLTKAADFTAQKIGGQKKIKNCRKIWELSSLMVVYRITITSDTNKRDFCNTGGLDDCS